MTQDPKSEHVLMPIIPTNEMQNAIRNWLWDNYKIGITYKTAQDFWGVMIGANSDMKEKI